MTDNKIRDEGAKAMSEMMRVNTTLASMDLSSEEKRGKNREQEKKENKNE